MYLVDGRGLSLARAAGVMPAVEQLGVIARHMKITQVGGFGLGGIGAGGLREVWSTP